MKNKRFGRIIGSLVLLATICVVIACGKETNEEEIHTMSPHESTAPIVFNAYSDITKITFSECFGSRLNGEGQYLVTVTATKNIIQYRCMIFDSLSKTNPEVIETEKVCDESIWSDLMLIFNDNNVGNWKEQGYYLNQYYNQQATLYEEWPDVRLAEIGDFFNLASPLRYYGVDQNEKDFRSDYSGDLQLYTDDQQSPYFSKSYDGYGLPKEYHHFEQEFWDCIIGYAGIYDWRYELSQWGKENMYKLYPYMQPNDESRQIRYFSFLESYGGRNSAVQASLVYDGGENTVTYECAYPEKTYPVGKSGIPVLYSDKQERYGGLYDNGKIEAVKEVPSTKEMLMDIIEKYSVDTWDAELVTRQTEYVRQGEFYNVENAKLAEDKNEKALRSGYDALLHVVYTNGEHIEVWLQNGHLPDLYNDFRDELWDHFIPCLNQDRAGEELVEDWRDYIDTWGEKYMHDKYPYMLENAE